MKKILLMLMLTMASPSFAHINEDIMTFLPFYLPEI